MTFAVVIFVVFSTIFRCHADYLPPPRDFSYKWVSSIALQLNWEEPENLPGLPEGCKIKYEVTSSMSKNNPMRVNGTTLLSKCPRENLNTEHWTYTITTVDSNDSGVWKNSQPINVNVSKPQANLVKDFRCIVGAGGMNCSWIPVHLSQKLLMSYCYCFSSTCTQVCSKFYSSESRRGCYVALPTPPVYSDVRFHLRSAIEESIVKPHFELHIPELSVKEEENQLKLTWRPKKFGNSSNLWSFEFCYTKCNGNTECFNITAFTHRIPYEKNCQYTFRTRVFTDSYSLSSRWSQSVTIGVNKPPDRTLTIVAVTVPIILFVSVILSCYCFRKHSKILCPNTPDPSALFKEFMVHTGNQRSKSEQLYRPVPEVTVPCQISINNDNSDDKVG